MKTLAILAAPLFLIGCGGSRKAVRIDLPLPAKLDLTGYEHVYFPGFIADAANPHFDTGKETINFFRREFTRREIIDVVPEDTVDLSGKDPREFFKRDQPFFKTLAIGHQENTLAVTGVVTFEILDRSGFREVKGTDSYGRAYYRTQFVEMTGFKLNMRVFVYDIKEGQLLYRDVLRDATDVQGDNVDVRLVYYDLLQRISDRVLGLFTSTMVKAERNLL